jgi:type IV pilus assembly protein PilC
MLFHYTAIDPTGNTVEDDYEGDTLNDVLHVLSGKSLQPISVKEVKRLNLGINQFFGGGITTSDKVFLTKYLSLMLRVGADLLSAVNILIADFDKPAVHNFLIEVRENLSKGKPFYEVFGKYKSTFSPTFVNLVKAAEASGNLQKTFEDLSNNLEHEAELRSHVRSAMIYPAVLFSVASGIVIFLTTFALPKVANVFTSGGIKPPWFSQIVFSVGLFIGGHILIIAVVLIALIAFIVWGIQKTQTGEKFMDHLLATAPFISGIARDIATQQMAATMSSLLKAGLPITQAITVAADTVSLRGYRLALLRVANEGLAKGLTIGEAFKREPVFPKSLTNLVAISEKAGHLEEVLETLAQFYGSSVDANIKALISLLEPAMLLGMGVMVGIIALSIIIPIYQLTSQF